MRPIRRQRVHELVISEIQRNLASRDLKPGDRLPPERELAAGLGVSRPSLREALRVLEMMGIVERRRGRGTYTREAEVLTLTTPFTTILLEQRPFVLETLELRSILEPPIARLAAQRGRTADIRTLKQILRTQRESVARGESMLDADIAFHRAIARASKNSVIARAIDSLQDVLREWRTIWVQGRPGFSVEGHERIVEAIARKDGAAAEEAMRHHLMVVEEQVRQYLDRSEERRVADGAARGSGKPLGALWPG